MTWAKYRRARNRHLSHAASTMSRGVADPCVNSAMLARPHLAPQVPLLDRKSAENRHHTTRTLAAAVSDRVFRMFRATMVLSATAPFRLDLTTWALRRRSKNTVDRWNGAQYTRIIVLDNKPAKLTITQETRAGEPALVVVVESEAALDDRIKREVGPLVQRILGLTIDLQPFYVLAAKNDSLGAVVEKFNGVKPPQFASVFEGLINAVACQQVTLDLGILLINRLSDNFGARFVDRDVAFHAFPEPADLAIAPEEAVKALGFSYQKARAIKELATNVAENRTDLVSLGGMTNKHAIEYLSTIRGIGRWSAEYVLLRGLGRLDTFPGDDIGAQNNLQRMFDLEGKPNYEKIRQLTSGWHPYEGVVNFHLLLEKLSTKGVI
jgi:DNA-3-methyladenine glycosylase II